MLPGSSYLAFAYDQNNYCRFAFHVRGNGSFHGANVVDQQGNTHCKISMSGNSVAITFFRPQVATTYTIQIKNKTKIAVPQYHNQTAGYTFYPDIQFYNSSGSNLNLPTIAGNQSSTFTATMHPDERLFITYGINDNYQCKFQIVPKNDSGGRGVVPIVMPIQASSSMACTAVLSQNTQNKIILTVGISTTTSMVSWNWKTSSPVMGKSTSWLPSALCVKNSAPKTVGSGTEGKTNVSPFLVNVSLENGAHTGAQQIKPGTSSCWNYAKNIKILISDPYSTNLANTTIGQARTDSLSAGVIQPGLINRVVIDTVSAHDVRCDARIAGNLKGGNKITFSPGWYTDLQTMQATSLINDDASCVWGGIL